METDHRDEGQGRDTGQGYPEEQPSGATPSKDGTERGPEAGTGGADAPDRDKHEDSGPSAATGNPNAAG